MFRQLWDGLIKFFQQLFGRETSPQTLTPPKPRPTLNDVECEAIFMRLLEGVDEGWGRGYVKGFLDSKPLTDIEWIAWLRRFEERLQEAPLEHEELARRMVRLGEIRGEKLGEVTKEIGRRILAQIPQPAPSVPSGDGIWTGDVIEAEFKGNGL